MTRIHSHTTFRLQPCADDARQTLVSFDHRGSEPAAAYLLRRAAARGRYAVGLLDARLLFRWKRDGRLSRDMTCCLCGRSVRGRRSKEPDITVAMFRAAKHDGGLVTVYEPNMARVDVDDPKGLEIALLLAAVVIRDLHLAPRPDPFNLAAGLPDRLPAHAGRHADAGAEEQRRIRTMLDDEDRQRRQREADVERETKRLRREYGVTAPDEASAGPAPALPPRTGQDGLPARYGGR